MLFVCLNCSKSGWQALHSSVMANKRICMKQGCRGCNVDYFSMLFWEFKGCKQLTLNWLVLCGFNNRKMLSFLHLLRIFHESNFRFVAINSKIRKLFRFCSPASPIMDFESSSGKITKWQTSSVDCHPLTNSSSPPPPPHQPTTNDLFITETSWFLTASN